MRPTGLARFRAGCPHAPLRSNRDRHSSAHRPWAPRVRTFTTSRAGAGAAQRRAAAAASRPQ
eukprot:6558709-Prymnesium_polylepis.1